MFFLSASNRLRVFRTETGPGDDSEHICDCYDIEWAQKIVDLLNDEEEDADARTAHACSGV